MMNACIPSCPDGAGYVDDDTSAWTESIGMNTNHLDCKGREPGDCSIEARLSGTPVDDPDDYWETVSYRMPRDRCARIRHGCLFWPTICLLFLAIIITAIAVPLAKKQKADQERVNDNIFGQSEADESNRLEQMRTILLPISGDALSDPSTRQYSALAWLADEDGAAMDPDEENSDAIADRYIAALLYFSTKGQGWTNQLNFLSDLPVCDWNDGGDGGDGVNVQGITCEDGIVTGITLDLNSLAGTIPSETAMYSLTNLGLGSNNIEGTIPSELGNMDSLTSLRLSKNSLTGSVPAELANLRHLTDLLLLDNRLTGTFHLHFRLLSSLNVIFIEGNDIVGNLERSFCFGGNTYENFYADCLGPFPQIICPCCTHCCENGQNCQSMETR